MDSQVLSVLLKPIHATLLTISIFAGLLAAWWLFPLGLLCWGLLVWMSLRDPSKQLSRKMEKRQPLSNRFQALFDRVERNQVAIFNAIQSSDKPLRRAMKPIDRLANSLVEEVYQLSLKMTRLENYRLVSVTSDNPDAEIESLEQKVASAADARVRREYEDALLALRQRQESLDAVSARLERVEAIISGVSRELDRVLADVIRLQSLDSRQAKQVIDDLAGSLRQQQDELKETQRDAGDAR
jgi:hypothetical protein